MSDDEAKSHEILAAGSIYSTDVGLSLQLVCYYLLYLSITLNKGLLLKYTLHSRPSLRGSSFSLVLVRLSAATAQLKIELIR